MSYEKERCCRKNDIFLRRIRRDIAEIHEGLRETCEGLRDIQNDCICEGEHEVLEGICDEEKGLRHLEEDLKELHCGPCRDKEEIEEGLHDIYEGIKEEKIGLAEMLEGKVCEGIQDTREGICHVEEGIKEVLEGLKDFEF